MTDESNWLRRLTRRVTKDVFGGATPPATTDASLLADLHKQAAYDRRDYEQRVRNNNEILGALAPFQDRLEALHTLAETTPDPLASGSYGWLHRTMDEELGLIAGDLQRGELTFDDIPAKFDEWRGLGTSYAATISGEEAAAAIFTTPAAAALPTNPAALADIGQQHRDAAIAGLNGAVSQLQTELETDTGRDDEVWAWVERGGVDLGHTELITRIEARANAAYHAGDRDLWWQLNDVAARFEYNMQDDGLAVIRTAVTLPDADRQAYLDSQQEAVRQRAQQTIAGLVDDLDLTTPEPVTDHGAEVSQEAARLQHQARVDNDVRAAYDMKLLLLADEPVHAVDLDYTAGNRWLYLSDLRAELDEQARLAGREPHSREDVDAALQRLTRDEATTVHLIPEDHDHLLTDTDRAAAVAFGGAERHMIRIDYPEPAAVAPESFFDDTRNSADAAEHDATTEQAGQDDAVRAGLGEIREGRQSEVGSVSEDAEPRIRSLASRADFAEMNAERLDDANLPGQAARLREQAKQTRREAQQLADDAGLESLDDEDDDADEDSDEAADEDADGHRMADTAAAVDDFAETSQPQHEDDAARADEPAADDYRSSVNDDSSATELREDTLAGDDETVEAEPVATTETTACAIAVTRAHCAIDRAHRQLDTAEQEAAAERDDELARWHADDTTAQTENQQTQNHDATDASVRGE